MKDLSRFTLEEKVGQLFFLGFRDHTPDPETQMLLDRIRPGGIILSQRNIQTFDQTAALTAQFIEGRDVPALVGIGQEGGSVDRLKQLFEPLPSMNEVAAGGVTQMRVLARLVASELEALGFNTLLGPVLDLSSPDSVLRDRAMAMLPREVSRLGRAYIEELSQRGLLVCPKHFPGLGSARSDPHFVLPSIHKPKKELLREDVQAFGDLLHVPMMMVSNAHYPELMEGRPRPACLSPRVVQGLLRRKLGFAGVIVTDDMTMGAVSSTGLTPERFLEAIEAGNDMVLFSETTPLVAEAFRTILDAARKNAAIRARVERSAGRVVSLKQTLIPSARSRGHARARVSRQITRFGRAIAQQPQRLPTVPLHS